MVGDKVASALDEDVRPVALLVDDTANKTVVVSPGGGWTAREALDATKCRVLFEVSLSTMSRRQKPHLNDN